MPAKRGRRRPYLDGYIAIPIYLPDQPEGQNPVAYLGRFAGEKETWTDETPRYKFPADFPRNEVVYGLREALRDSRDDQPLILVEGAFKCFWLWQEAGLANVVASFGSSLSLRQAELLVATGRPIVLMFDGNARQAMRTAAARLIRETFIRVVTLAEDQEPDHLSGDGLRRLLHFAY
jgi:DNA primase